MKIPYYQVDAFTSELFGGNPAGVCPLNEPLPEDLMQKIAAENRLPETAFFYRENEGYYLRWFTPTVEIDLCGHGTLATAFVLFNYLEPGLERVEFDSLSGILTVTKKGDLLTLDFPALQAKQVEMDNDLIDALGVKPSKLYLTRDLLAVFESEAQVESISPDFEKLGRVKDGKGVIVTAPGDNSDFVSRFFGPKLGIPEDPVTGSAHTTLTPYWSKRLGRRELHAFQISERRGELWLEDRGDRVAISGKAVLYKKGEIFL